MPLPKPKKDETQSDYVSRCMEAQSDEDKPQDQKLAICYSKYRDSKNEDVIEVNKYAEITESLALEPGDRIRVISEASKGKVGTSEYNLSGNNTVINYRGTNVVTFNKDTIVLDPNGWWTKTTKRRMNQASDEHGLGYWVYQKQGQWYVDYDGRTIPFNGSLVILDR